MNALSDGDVAEVKVVATREVACSVALIAEQTSEQRGQGIDRSGNQTASFRDSERRLRLEPLGIAEITEEQLAQSKQHYGLPSSAEGPALPEGPMQARTADHGWIMEAAVGGLDEAWQMRDDRAQPIASSSRLPQQSIGFSGIQLVTASGKPIQQTSKNLSRAANLFADLFEEPGSTGKPNILGADNSNLGEVASPAFHLTTASGKKLEVGKAALERGRQFMSEIATDAAGEERPPIQDSLKRRAPWPLTATDPVTPVQVEQRQAALLLGANEAVKTADLLDAASEVKAAQIRPAWLGQRQGGPAAEKRMQPDTGSQIAK